MLEASNCINLNVFAYYKNKDKHIHILHSLRNSNEWSVDPSFTFNRTEMCVLWTLPPVLELWLVCAQKTKSLRSHSTFFLSSSSSSPLLGGSQFWGSGCETFAPCSLPSSPHPFVTSSAGQVCSFLWKHLDTARFQVHGTHLGAWQVYQEGKMVRVSSDALFSPRKFHGQKGHWCLCFSPTFFLCG